jgi:hypothetical protein
MSVCPGVVCCCLWCAISAVCGPVSLVLLAWADALGTSRSFCPSSVLSRSSYGFSVPLISAYCALPLRLKWRRERDLQDGTSDARPSIFSSISRTFTGTLGPIHQFTSTFLPRSSTYHPDSSTHGNAHLPAFAAQGQQSPSHAKPPPFVRKIKVLMYNYGSPKVGNGNFANFYDKMVPASYRVVVDGDIVPALPPQSNYSHVGTEILIDSMGAGKQIVVLLYILLHFAAFWKTFLCFYSIELFVHLFQPAVPTLCYVLQARSSSTRASWSAGCVPT